MRTAFTGALLLHGSPPRSTRADLVIDDGVIASVGEGTAADRSVDATGFLITPGLVNGHVHLNQVLNRGSLDDLTTEQLLAGMHARHDAKSDEDRYWASLLAIAEALRCGTTYFSAFATSPSLIYRALLDAGIRGTITIAPKDQWWGDGHQPETRETSAIISKLAKLSEVIGSPRIALSLGAASDRAASEPLLRGVKDLARSNGLRTYIHTAEGATAVELSVRHRGMRPVEFLYSVGFLDGETTLVHCSNVSDLEIQIIADSGAGVVHCPTSNAKTCAGVMPLQRMLRAKVPVGLGTDASSSNNTNNVLLEAHVATIVHRVAGAQSHFPTAADMFGCLTTLGAAAVGSDVVVGDLRPGAKADFVLWRLDQTHFFPFVDDPLSAFVHCASESIASQVWVDGVCIFDGEPTLFDISDVRREVATRCRAGDRKRQ